MNAKDSRVAPAVAATQATARRPRRAASNAPQHAHGVTLVEIVIAVAIIGLLLATGVPAMGQWLAEVRLRTAAYALSDVLALARSEAIKHGARANVCKSTDGRRCTSAGAWEAGWILFHDDNANGIVDAGEPIVRATPAADPGITARANQPLANYVSFTPLGHARLLSGALQMGTFTVCRRGLRAYHVVLANTGRVRVERAPEVCS